MRHPIHKKIPMRRCLKIFKVEALVEVEVDVVSEWDDKTVLEAGFKFISKLYKK
jgi:hypothetical protein